MSAPKHTPGPMHVMDGGRWIGVDDGTKYHRIACVAELRQSNHVSQEEMLANANLFAAAPDLLEALEEWRAWLRDGNPKPFSEKAWRLTEAAIAKAKGETK